MLHAFRYIRLIVVEALRLYPQPPLLIRRSLKPDVLPGIDFYRLLNEDGMETNYITVVIAWYLNNAYYYFIIVEGFRM